MENIPSSRYAGTQAKAVCGVKALVVSGAILFFLKRRHPHMNACDRPSNVIVWSTDRPNHLLEGIGADRQ